ncbi:MAG: hypothetical protein ACE5GJ_09085 [Gemmatimonadota bacterium]
MRNEWWKKQFLEHGAEVFGGSEEVKTYEARISQLERMLGQTEAELALQKLHVSTRLVETNEWGNVPFAEATPGVFVLWSCTGDVAAVALADQDGTLERANPTPYREELNLYALREAATDEQLP